METIMLKRGSRFGILVNSDQYALQYQLEYYRQFRADYTLSQDMDDKWIKADLKRERGFIRRAKMKLAELAKLEVEK